MTTIKRTTVPTKVPGIPKPPVEISAGLRRYLENLSEAVEIRLGRRGDQRDRAITLRELIDSGLAVELAQRPFDPNAGGSTFTSSQPEVDTTIFAGRGAMISLKADLTGLFILFSHSIHNRMRGTCIQSKYLRQPHQSFPAQSFRLGHLSVPIYLPDQTMEKCRATNRSNFARAEKAPKRN